MTDYTISAQTETTRTLNINVDNGMNSLKESMLTFASNIEDGLSVKRDRVAQELEQFKRKINELAEQKRKLFEKLETLRTENQSLRDQIEKYKRSNQEFKEKEQEYLVKIKQCKQTRQGLMDEARELDELLSKREASLEAYKSQLYQQQQRDDPEVQLYERLLGMSIDASMEGVLTFSFDNFDGENVNRKCSLTLDVSSNDRFEIIHTVPALPQGSADHQYLENILDVGDNFPVFIAKARELLVARSLPLR